MATNLDLAGETRSANEHGTGKGLRDGNVMEQRRTNPKKNYLKEATVTVDICNVNARAEDIIKVIAEKIGRGNILAVRPKQNKEYEVTLENVEDVELLVDGLKIKEILCEVKRLQNRDYVVSFMHMPAYIDDQVIVDKLEGWGVTPISEIKRRVYPGTTVEDGTRFVKSRFPEEVVSLPYSTRLETAEGLQYFRVMHSHQIKTCRLCMSPEHVLKDCPDFKCYKCEERGHFARDCNAVKCPDCKKVLIKCECWYEDEETHVRGQVRERDSVSEQEEEGMSEIREDQAADNDSDGEQEEEEKMDEDCSKQEKETEVQRITNETVRNEIDRQAQDEQCKNTGEDMEQRDQRSQDSQAEGTGTQIAIPDAYENISDADEDLNDGGEGKEAGTSRVSIRKRLTKVKSSLEGKKKRNANKDYLRNRFELLKDLDDTS